MTASSKQFIDQDNIFVCSQRETVQPKRCNLTRFHGLPHLLPLIFLGILCQFSSYKHECNERKVSFIIEAPLFLSELYKFLIPFCQVFKNSIPFSKQSHKCKHFSSFYIVVLLTYQIGFSYTF